MAASKAKKQRESGSFAAIPHRVLQSRNYALLSFKAVKLLVDLSGQIVFRKGGDQSNGDLCAAFSVMRKYGWRSSDTLDAAERELLHYGFIEITQPGNRNNPTLYAVTWLCVSHFENKPWIKSTRAPSSKWKIEVEPMPPRRKPSEKKAIPEDWATPYPILGLSDQFLINRYPRIGSIGRKIAVSVTRGLGTSIALPYALPSLLIWLWFVFKNSMVRKADQSAENKRSALALSYAWSAVGSLLEIFVARPVHG